MIWNFWCRCINPLRCGFWDKDSMADAPVVLLSSKAEICAQPISPFPSRLHGGLPAAPGGDNGGGGRVDGVDAVVHGPHLAPALHRSGHAHAAKQAGEPGAADRADLRSAFPERRRGGGDGRRVPGSRLPPGIRRRAAAAAAWIGGGIGAGEP